MEPLTNCDDCTHHCGMSGRNWAGTHYQPAQRCPENLKRQMAALKAENEAKTLRIAEILKENDEWKVRYGQASSGRADFMEERNFARAQVEELKAEIEKTAANAFVMIDTLTKENAALDESLKAAIELNEQYAMQNAELRERLARATSIIDGLMSIDDLPWCDAAEEFLAGKEAQREENSGD